jgi:hypothetical protein
MWDKTTKFIHRHIRTCNQITVVCSLGLSLLSISSPNFRRLNPIAHSPSISNPELQKIVTWSPSGYYIFCLYITKKKKVASFPRSVAARSVAHFASTSYIRLTSILLLMAVWNSKFLLGDPQMP